MRASPTLTWKLWLGFVIWLLRESQLSSICKNVQNYRAIIAGPGHPARHPINDYISIGIVVKVGFAGTETKNQTDLKVCFRDKRPSGARRKERQARLGENKQQHSHASWSVITISLVGNFVVESILKSDADVHTVPDRNWKESVNCLTLPGLALSLGTFGESFVDQAPLGLALPAAH